MIKDHAYRRFVTAIPTLILRLNNVEVVLLRVIHAKVQTDVQPAQLGSILAIHCAFSVSQTKRL